MEILAVEHLHGFEFKHAGTADISRNDILRQLGMRSRRSSDRVLRPPSEKPSSLFSQGMIELSASENTAVLFHLTHHPGKNRFTG